MHTPVSFEIAKLLKEKGFDVECCEYYYMEDNPNTLRESFNKSKKWDFNFKNEYLKPCKSISAPTITEVVMWLYEKHEIWIWVEKQYNPIYFRPIIDCTTPTSKTHRPDLYLHSPTEAYEAAIEYILNNLI